MVSGWRCMMKRLLTILTRSLAALLLLPLMLTVAVVMIVLQLLLTVGLAIEGAEKG